MANTPAFDETQHPREVGSGRFAAKPQAAADPAVNAALAGQAQQPAAGFTAELDIPEDAWQPASLDHWGHSYLELPRWNALTIAGVPFHINAIEVDDKGDAVAEDLEAEIGHLTAVCGDGPLMTVPINGRNYVLAITPFAS